MRRSRGDKDVDVFSASIGGHSCAPNSSTMFASISSPSGSGPGRGCSMPRADSSDWSPLGLTEESKATICGTAWSRPLISGRDRPLTDARGPRKV